MIHNVFIQLNDKRKITLNTNRQDVKLFPRKVVNKERNCSKTLHQSHISCLSPISAGHYQKAEKTNDITAVIQVKTQYFTFCKQSIAVCGLAFSMLWVNTCKLKNRNEIATRS